MGMIYSSGGGIGIGNPGKAAPTSLFFFSGKMPIIWVKTNKNSNKLIKELLRIKLSGISTLVSLDTRIVNI